MKDKQVGTVFRHIVAVTFGIIIFLFGFLIERAGKISIKDNSEIILCVLLTLVLILLTVLASYVIVQKRKNNKKLIDADQMYLNLISNMQGGVITCIFDIKTSSSKTIYINEGWTEITGYTLDDLNNCMGGNPQALVLPEDRKISDKEYIEQTSNGNSYKLQYRVKRKNGDIVWVIDKGIVTVQKDGNIQNQSILTEVTEIKENEEQMRKLAQTDQLTKLYNKMEAATAVQKILKDKKHGVHALMVLDIDDFKGINDSLGHIFGDTVLIEVSTKLKRLFRSNDIIGRIGGDEFLILMSDISSKAVAEKKAAEVCGAFRNTYVGETGQYKISCSLGIVFSGDGIGYQDLFHKADIALYRAKTKGKDQYVIYNDGDDQEMRAISEGHAKRENKFKEKDSGELEIKERFFELLYGSVDFNGSINMALSLLGRMMEVGRIYVFENSTDNKTSTCTYEWCGECVASTIANFKNIPIAEIGYLELFDESGIFVCSDLGELKPEIRKLWGSQNVCSLLQVAIKENGIFCGFIGFDDFLKTSSPTKENRNLMIFAAKVIGIFILKKRAEEKTQIYNRNKIEALDSLPNYIYVIDDQFNIHYMNRKTQEAMPSTRLGDICYMAFMGNKSPCEGCPVKKWENNETSCTTIYNPYVKQTLISSMSKITWQGRENMNLICCHDVTNTYKENNTEIST